MFVAYELNGKSRKAPCERVDAEGKDGTKGLQNLARMYREAPVEEHEHTAVCVLIKYAFNTPTTGQSEGGTRWHGVVAAAAAAASAAFPALLSIFPSEAAFGIRNRGEQPLGDYSDASTEPENQCDMRYVHICRSGIYIYFAYL
ncbi:hypothetical protein WA026_005769 [Henosepilachna vigintioctopunctata]|uniref:Uncharacterized protein n=1 Tax=Henosepilachna vigintioctopunctata TaxID=420089 RepID=A0AAW1U2S7_9CUCU